MGLEFGLYFDFCRLAQVARHLMVPQTPSQAFSPYVAKKWIPIEGRSIFNG